MSPISSSEQKNSIPRTWECFRSELQQGIKIDASVKISDRTIFQGKHTRIMVVAEEFENGTLRWCNTITIEAEEVYTCGCFETIHEAYHDARAALAGWFIFNSMDYLGLEDSDTLGAM